MEVMTKENTELKDEFQKEAEKQVFQVFPRKIADLSEALQGKMFDASNLAVIHSDPMIPMSPLMTNGSDLLPISEDDLKSVTKKTKLDDEIDGFPALGGKRPLYFGGTVTGNAKVQATIDFIKPEILAVIDSCNSLKIWLWVLIPRIEDGNNFGVAIQKQVLRKVNAVESEAMTYLKKILRYFNVRAKIVSKIAKYPLLEDYRRALKEYDEKAFFSFKLMVTELRNMYAVMHDVIIKNYDKLIKPRTSHAHAMY